MTNLTILYFLLLTILHNITADEVEQQHHSHEILSEEMPTALSTDESIQEQENTVTSSSSTIGDPSSSPKPTLNDVQTQQLFSLAKKFQLVCCMGGIPQLTHPELVRNFTFQSVSYVVDRDGNGIVGPQAMDQSCRLFKGAYLLPQPSLLFGVSVELAYAAHVTCKCPELGMGHALDRSCRRLPNCQNNGFRSLLDPRRCFCLEPFFGERCEKLCDRGRRMRGPDGRDYCSCAPFYRGDECRDPVCINGGRPLPGGTGCECAPHFLGFHCEIDANRTQPIGRHDFVGHAGGSSRFHQRFGPEQGNEMFSRDVSGTVFSLVMIVVLVLSMYLLMKHRMQVQTRYLSSRRADLLGACTFPPPPSMGQQHLATLGSAAAPAATVVPGQARRVELLPIGDGHSMSRAFPPFVRSLAPFFASDGGPPPYAPPGQRARRPRNEILPPLPSYEDATKLPPLRTATLVVEGGEEQPPPSVEATAEVQAVPAPTGDEQTMHAETAENGQNSEHGRSGLQATGIHRAVGGGESAVMLELEEIGRRMDQLERENCAQETGGNEEEGKNEQNR